MQDPQMIQLFTNERELLTETHLSFLHDPLCSRHTLRPKGRLSCTKDEDMGC